MNPIPRITVAIVEDNAAIGASLQQVVETSDNLQLVGLWRSGEEALLKVEAFRPQVVLMDINLPGISGIEVTARVKHHLPEVQIIMITVYRDHNKIFAALKAGASGYLLKRSTTAEVRAAITDVLAGGAPMSAEIARRIVDAFHQSPGGSGGESDLSPREAEVLEQLGEGFGTKEIAESLGISFETVRVHLRRIYKKLHVRSRTQAVLKFRNSCNPGNWMSQSGCP
jgi:DNA-binding NarL/FixJ family response regulator